jgi:hypothetical protein
MAAKSGVCRTHEELVTAALVVSRHALLQRRALTPGWQIIARLRNSVTIVLSRDLTLAADEKRKFDAEDVRSAS